MAVHYRPAGAARKSNPAPAGQLSQPSYKLPRCSNTLLQVPLSSALPFLEGALWGASERRRTAAVARNLRRSEHVALLGQLADERQRWVLGAAIAGGGRQKQGAQVGQRQGRRRLNRLLNRRRPLLYRSVLLTPERNCSLCFKRVGTAALVAFPTGLLAHYSCWRRASGGGGGGTTGAAAGAAGAAGAAAGNRYQLWA